MVSNGRGKNLVAMTHSVPRNEMPDQENSTVDFLSSSPVTNGIKTFMRSKYI